MCQAFRCASAQQAHERVATLAKAFGTLLARKQMKDASDAQSSVYQAPSPTTSPIAQKRNSLQLQTNGASNGAAGGPQHRRSHSNTSNTSVPSLGARAQTLPRQGAPRSISNLPEGGIPKRSSTISASTSGSSSPQRFQTSGSLASIQSQYDAGSEELPGTPKQRSNSGQFGASGGPVRRSSSQGAGAAPERLLSSPCIEVTESPSDATSDRELTGGRRTHPILDKRKTNANLMDDGGGTAPSALDAVRTPAPLSPRVSHYFAPLSVPLRDTIPHSLHCASALQPSKRANETKRNLIITLTHIRFLLPSWHLARARAHTHTHTHVHTRTCAVQVTQPA